MAMRFIQATTPRHFWRFTSCLVPLYLPMWQQMSLMQRLWDRHFDCHLHGKPNILTEMNGIHQPRSSQIGGVIVFVHFVNLDGPRLDLFLSKKHVCNPMPAACLLCMSQIFSSWQPTNFKWWITASCVIQDPQNWNSAWHHLGCLKGGTEIRWQEAKAT